MGTGHPWNFNWPRPKSHPLVCACMCLVELCVQYNISVYGLHVVFCMLGRMVRVSGVIDVCIVCYPYNMCGLYMWFVYIRHKYMWLMYVVCVSLCVGE